MLKSINFSCCSRMNKIHFISLLLLIFNAELLLAQSLNNAKYIKPLIGTDGTGHTFPGVTVPFGFVQLSPDTDFQGWDHCAGYHYADTSILGFSHTHLSGTGGKDLGDILLMPFTGKTVKDSYRSRFSHQAEAAAAGYYFVKLKDYDVEVALTATQRTAFHQYKFNSGGQEKILLDLRHGLVQNEKRLESHVISSALNLEDAHTISGYTISSGWAGKQHVYFSIKFQKPIMAVKWLSDSLAKQNQRVVLIFNEKESVQQIKVGISTVSIANAKDNLLRESPSWNFEDVRNNALKLWDNYLDKVNIEGSKKQKEIFYTAMYHALIAPNNIADLNGDYRGADNQVYNAKSKSYYSTLSLWDTYRALHPLYTILYPKITNEIVETMLAHFDVQGYLSIWTLWGHENYCMIGNHAIPVITDAYLKGIRNYNVDKAFEALKISATVNHQNSRWDLYQQYGYLPADSIKKESVSITLENVYDDWCIAQMAKKMGKSSDYTYFNNRSNFYKNLFDKKTGFMRAKNADGSWVGDFNPYKISHASSSGGPYTEANAWQYTWHVQHDVNGLIDLMGGKRKFAAKLDSLFTISSNIDAEGSTADITGLIGQYVHGNEPSHHVAYLYSYVDEAWKTQKRVSQIVKTLYSNTPDGISGNDDCGQMSAWYIFSTLGFYPVNPANSEYVFGTPAFKSAELQLGSKKFKITADNLSETNIYIQRIELDGRPYAKKYIHHNDIMKGGHLRFYMTNKPKK
ncbi:glycoside hydrolase family 92 protein [Pedobacter hiemivivus]|uniref:Glycoside hydrolase family 92 protein n=2 Tax=Pedobacter hiemivivus TaxID=2530454 RepID=A0A4R0N1L4_9SPHI|nr:glycoside hydrolase family 92 protein [Pedobacter hiemivivus]